MGLDPRFDETVPRYIDYLVERAVPRIKPTNLYAKLSKRDTMHFDCSEATIFATPQMIYDVAMWACMGPVIRSEVGKFITLHLSCIPPARIVPEATPASSDEEERKDTRTVRFMIPPCEEVEKALVSSVSNEEKETTRSKKCERQRARQFTRRRIGR